MRSRTLRVVPLALACTDHGGKADTAAWWTSPYATCSRLSSLEEGCGNEGCLVIECLGDDGGPFEVDCSYGDAFMYASAATLKTMAATCGTGWVQSTYEEACGSVESGSSPPWDFIVRCSR